MPHSPTHQRIDPADLHLPPTRPIDLSHLVGPVLGSDKRVHPRPKALP